LEERINSCACVQLTGLCISEFRLTLAQRRAVCTVFLEKMSVFEP
jgi:hypothetical protein